MKLASLRNGHPDGQLVVVSRDLTRFADASAIAPTLQAALDDWANSEPALRELSDGVNGGTVETEVFDTAKARGAAAALLPRR